MRRPHWCCTSDTPPRNVALARGKTGTFCRGAAGVAGHSGDAASRCRWGRNYFREETADFTRAFVGAESFLGNVPTLATLLLSLVSKAEVPLAG